MENKQNEEDTNKALPSITKPEDVDSRSERDSIFPKPNVRQKRSSVTLQR